MICYQIVESIGSYLLPSYWLMVHFRKDQGV